MGWFLYYFIIYKILFVIIIVIGIPTENTHSSGSFEMINEANETPAAEIPELNTETIETIGISSNDGNYIFMF